MGGAVRGCSDSAGLVFRAGPLAAACGGGKPVIILEVQAPVRKRHLYSRGLDQTHILPAVQLHLVAQGVRLRMPYARDEGDSRSRMNPKRRHARSHVAAGEMLEERQLLAADLSYEEVGELWAASLGTEPIATPLTNVVAEPLAGTASPSGFSPAQIRTAYGFDQVYFQNNTIVGDGTGQTIAIVNAYHTPNAASDLAAFSAYYGLPNAPSFVQVDQNGGTAYPATQGGWALETALDVQWVHALAPGANILLVEANTANFSDLFAAVDYARNVPGVSVVSMSWGAGEWAGETFFNQYLTTPVGHAGVTFFAAAGNSGGPGVFPAYSPNVVAVGGTSVTLNGSNQIISETAWSGSGGGISQYQAQPSWQNGVVTQSATQRVMPDVAFLGNPNTGVAVYDTFNNSPGTPWSKVAGTSFAAPSWASLVAVANQGRTLAGLPVFDMNALMTRLYTMPASNFNDITSGSSTGVSQSAGVGYDAVTGRGTPKAALIVDSLVGVSSAPSGVTLLAASDTGISNSDRITRLNNSSGGQTLQFQVTGTVAGATVQIFSGATLIGSAVAGGASTIVTTNGSFTLLDGLRSITAKQTEPGEQQSAASPALQITIDTMAPTAAFAAVSPDPRTSPVAAVGLTFSEVVSGLNLSALSLSRNGGANLLTGSQSITTLDDITWSLNNLTTITSVSGVYDLLLTSVLSPVIDVAGNVAGNALESFTVTISVLGRMLFYNQSKFDGNDSAINAADDAAIATDKSPYIAGNGLANFSAVSSYSRGINGVMIDVAGTHPNISVNDFSFRVGSNNSLGSWTTAAVPTLVTVRAGAGVGGSDRITITWANEAISNQWLEVTLAANQNTGLATADTFYFGNRMGDTGLNTPPAVFSTSAGDELAARANPAVLQGVTNIYDFNRDSVVSGGDQLIARNNGGLLMRLNLAAPQMAMALVADDGDEDAIASALNAPVDSELESLAEPSPAESPLVEPLAATPLAATIAPVAERNVPQDRGLSLALAHAWLKRASEASDDSPVDDSLLNLLSAVRSRRGR